MKHTLVFWQAIIFFFTVLMIIYCFHLVLRIKKSRSYSIKIISKKIERVLVWLETTISLIDKNIDPHFLKNCIQTLNTVIKEYEHTLKNNEGELWGALKKSLDLFNQDSLKLVAQTEVFLKPLDKAEFDETLKACQESLQQLHTSYSKIQPSFHSLFHIKLKNKFVPNYFPIKNSASKNKSVNKDY
ncbi:MAG: hypothetical protein Q9M92_00955 [Enterobacterales bacterium]|nr:hypothetical protein [Enterobacterales bacterium]